jgi:hypothetical protein
VKNIEDIKMYVRLLTVLSPLNAELIPIRHLLALVRDHHFVDVSRIRVKVFV